jgi:glucose-6-phosphate-specific signal transduction histidine kinase
MPLNRQRELYPAALARSGARMGGGFDSRAAQLRVAALIGAMIVALQTADVLTTMKVVASGGVELNPVVALLMGLLGPAWWLPKLFFASLVAGYFGTRPVNWRAVAVLDVCAFVVFNNFAQLVHFA